MHRYDSNQNIVYIAILYFFDLRFSYGKIEHLKCVFSGGLIFPPKFKFRCWSWTTRNLKTWNISHISLLLILNFDILLKYNWFIWKIYFFSESRIYVTNFLSNRINKRKMAMYERPWLCVEKTFQY